MLEVSFFIVIIVVPQGKWQIVNIINDIAVIIVQLLFDNNVFNSVKEL